MSDPIIHRTRDGKLTLTGCDPVFVCARESLEDLICRHNKMADERDEARTENKRLEKWKQEALFVEKAWNPQEVGKLLGMPLAADIRANIQPRVQRLIEHRDRLAAALQAISRQRSNRYESTIGVVCNIADEALNQPREGSKS